jgi:hypothetical protein
MRGLMIDITETKRSHRTGAPCPGIHRCYTAPTSLLSLTASGQSEQQIGISAAGLSASSSERPVEHDIGPHT